MLTRWEYLARFFATLFSISVTPKWISYSDNKKAVDDNENEKRWYSPLHVYSLADGAKRDEVMQKAWHRPWNYAILSLFYNRKTNYIAYAAHKGYISFMSSIEGALMMSWMLMIYKILLQLTFLTIGCS